MKDEKLLKLFEDCLQDGETRWSGIHKDFNDDKSFIQFAEQLVNADGSEMKLKGRPRFVINKLIQYVKSVTNEMRKTSIVGHVYPIDNGADIDKAKVRRGTARGIERTSNAEYAYQYAGDEMVTGGMGAWRIDKEYVSDKSGDQTLKINRILDASTVMASHCIQPDYSDAKWFILKQNDKALVKWSLEWNKLNESDVNNHIWGTGEKPYDYEFWYRHDTPDILYRLNTGKYIYKSQVKKDADEALFAQKDGKRWFRDTYRRQWKQYRLKAKTIQSSEKWEGRFAPIVIVNGREVWHEGKRKLLSLCRYSKDSQRLYNYARQEMGRKLGWSPKAMWLAAIEAIPKKFQNMWNHVHEDTYGTLYYNSKDSAGRDLLPPTPVKSNPLDPALSQETMITDKELKDTSGVQAENLAEKSNASSGVAIRAKQNEGDTNTFDFQTSLAIAVQHSTRIIVDLIPRVIDTQRQIRYIGEDEAEKVIEVNKPYDNASESEKDEFTFNVEEEYDVGVSIGPSFDSKRQEDSENIMELMRVSQTAAQILPYLYVKNLDFPASEEASKLLKKALPPGIAEPDDEDGEKQPEIPQEIQQKLQQAQQMEMMLKQAAEKIKELESGANLKMKELESKQSIELAKLKQKDGESKAKNQLEQQSINVDKFEAMTDRMEAQINNRFKEMENSIKLLTINNNARQ